MRICRVCELEKEDSDFYQSDIICYNFICKICKSLKQKKYNKENKEKLREYRKKYYENNKKYIKLSHKKYDENNKEKIRERKNKTNKQKKKENPAFKLRSVVSSKINSLLKLNDSSKAGKSFLKYVDWNIDELKKHIENKFKLSGNEWMSWDNYKRYNKNTWNDNDKLTWTWTLDHIKPLSDFKYSTMDDKEFKKAWSLENMRPLSAKDNLLEGANRVRHKKL